MTGFASSDWSIVILAAVSFTESIFFPIPPDPLLVGIAILRPHTALWLGALVTVSSVAGALVGHWLGRRFGRPLIYKLVDREKVATVERLFNRYGGWAVLIAAFTPVPYKVFAISAGILDLDRRTFVVASLVGRGGRFLLLGALIFVFGQSIQQFIHSNFEIITAVFAAVLIAVLTAMAIVVRRRRARKALG